MTKLDHRALGFAAGLLVVVLLAWLAPSTARAAGPGGAPAAYSAAVHEQPRCCVARGG